MAGVMSLASRNRGQAYGMTSQAANLESSREKLGDQLEDAEKNQRTQMAASGAGIGTAILPGVGTAAGLAIGYGLAYLL